MVSFASEPQNTYPNQIRTIIIYREEMPKPKLDYFIKEKSEYVLDVCLTEITNSIF